MEKKHVFWIKIYFEVANKKTPISFDQQHGSKICWVATCHMVANQLRAKERRQQRHMAAATDRRTEEQGK